MTTSFSAYACYARHVLGTETIPVKAAGNVTVLIDSWALNLTSSHSVALSYTGSVMDFSTAASLDMPDRPDSLKFNCDAIQFLDPKDYTKPLKF